MGGGFVVSIGTNIRFGPLKLASFVERPNRFIVHARLEDSNEIVQAHLADPGRLKELLLPGARLYLRFVDKPNRKTKWSVILVLAPDGKTLVSLQSTLVNQLTAAALKTKKLPELANWIFSGQEYNYGNSRWDFLLEDSNGHSLLLEVKSCTLVVDGLAMFPDAVTERGRRHVEELTHLQSQGTFQTAILFVVQRGDADYFRPADHIDPAFAKVLKLAQVAGVQILVYSCQVTHKEITLGSPLRLEL